MSKKLLSCPNCSAKRKKSDWNKIGETRIQCADCKEIFKTDEVQTVKYVEKLKKWIKETPVLK